MRFELVTWNILADAYIKPGRYPNVNPVDLEPARRHPLIERTLRAQDADLYALQEVEAERFKAIARLLSGHEGIFAQKEGRVEGVALFVRRSAFRVRRHHILRYEAQHDRGNHLALVAELEAEGSGERLVVASTHLAWQPEQTPPARHVGALQLRQLLDAREGLVPGAAPWIICGDLNATSQSCVVQEATSRGLSLSCRQQRPWDTVNIGGRMRKLDYALYTTGALLPWPHPLPTLTRTTPMPNATFASDHLPICVRYESAPSK